jgi:hypothetical protein
VISVVEIGYVRRSELRSAFRGTAEMHAGAASAESNAIDPKRSFKASHSPTTEVLGSASHRLGRLREGRYAAA